MTFNTWMTLLSVVAANNEKKPVPMDSLDGRRMFALIQKGFIVVNHDPTGAVVHPTSKGLKATIDD